MGVDLGVDLGGWVCREGEGWVRMSPAYFPWGRYDVDENRL